MLRPTLIAVVTLVGCRGGSAIPVPAPPEPLPDAMRCETTPGPECFVPVQGGTFLMGAQASDPDAPGYDPLAKANEGPVRSVTVSSFWLMRLEVLVSTFTRCVGQGKCDESQVSEGGFSNYPKRDSHPVNSLSFRGAQEVCRFIGGRLPTEAEWEYAARSTENQRYPHGDEAPCTGDGHRFLAVCGNDGTTSSLSAGSESPFGAIAMTGNVWEWTSDWYAAPLSASPALNPTGPESGNMRVQKGGGWLALGPEDLRAAQRGSMTPETRVNDVGVRCAAP